MKYLSSLFLLFFSLQFSFSHAQVAVQDRPRAPRQITAAQICHAKSIWIKGHWKWDKKQGKYLWIEGNCHKARKGYTYQPGFWFKVEEGWMWEPGKWEKVKHYSSAKKYPW